MPAKNPSAPPPRPRRNATTVVPPTTPPSADAPDAPNGVRWELVARMKALIAAGELDTPDRWAITEELMFADAEAR